MFQTLSMEVRPFPTVNAPPPAPAPTASSVAPSVPEQPPPPPTNTTTAASAGPASPHDASQGEDATNGHSSSRRPGNLWTAEDREDMFNRRENGEGWETICADYPNRSRHAMQQQYSMMKKQKALADGTWASNRRGRKRRNPAPERAPAAAKRMDPYPDGDEQMTEADDFEEPNSDDTEVYDDSGAKMSNGRPNPLMRSSTEPAKSGRQRNMQSGSAGVTPSNGNRAASQQPDPDPTYTTGRQSKKRRLSGDQTSTLQVSTPSDAAEYQPSNVALDYDEVFALLRKGVEQARTQRRSLEQERAQRTASYAASLQRANRRANEAHERFSWATYEHGETVKKIRGEAALVLKDKVREHTEAMEKLAAQRKADQETHHKKVMEQVNVLADLRKEIQMFKMDPTDRERAMIEQIDRLKADKKALEDAKREWEATAKAAPQPSAVQHAGNPSSDNAASNMENLARLESSVYGSSKLITDDFDRIAAMVSKFHDEFDDLGHKRTVQYLVDIVALKDGAVSNVAQLTDAAQELHQAFTEIVQKTPEVKSAVPAAVVTPPVTRLQAFDGSASPAPATVPTISESPAPPSISVEGPTPVAASVSPVNETVATESLPSPPKQGPDAPLLSIQEGRVPVATMASVPPPSETPDVEMKDEEAKDVPQPDVIAPHPVAANEPPADSAPAAVPTPQLPEENQEPGAGHSVMPQPTQDPANVSGDAMQQ